MENELDQCLSLHFPSTLAHDTQCLLLTRTCCPLYAPTAHNRANTVLCKVMCAYVSSSCMSITVTFFDSCCEYMHGMYRFEAMAIEYDSDDIGELDEEEFDGDQGTATVDQFGNLLDEFLEQHPTQDHNHEAGYAYDAAGAGADGQSTPLDKAAIAKVCNGIVCKGVI